MGVRADHEAGASVKKMPHRLLFRSRLAVEIHHDGIRKFAHGTGIDLPLHRHEGTIKRIHIDPPHRIHDQNARAIARGIEIGTAPGHPGGIVDRTQKGRLAITKDKRIALVPGMVAGGDDIGPRIQQVFDNLLGDAEPGSGILSVDDHEIEAITLDEARQFVEHDVTARAPHDVADE